MQPSQLQSIATNKKN